MASTSSKKERKRQCEACGGTGQLSYFKGVSRFLLSVEECPLCAGLGFVMEPAAETPDKEDRQQ